MDKKLTSLDQVQELALRSASDSRGLVAELAEAMAGALEGLVGEDAALHITWSDVLASLEYEQAALEKELTELTEKKEALSEEISEIESFLASAERDIRDAISYVLGNTPPVAAVSQLPRSITSAKLLPFSYPRYIQYRFPFIEAISVVQNPRGMGTVDIYALKEDRQPLTDAEKLEVSAWLTDWFKPHYTCWMDKGYPVPWLSVSSGGSTAGNVKFYVPTTANVNITVFVRPARGYAFSEIEPLVEERLRSFFGIHLLGVGVSIADLGNLLFSMLEIENYRFALPASDLAARATVLPKVGNITIRELGG